MDERQEFAKNFAEEVKDLDDHDHMFTRKLPQSWGQVRRVNEISKTGTSYGIMLFGTIMGIIIIIFGFWLSAQWYYVMESWSGDWPKLAVVIAWFILGGIELIVLIGALGAYIIYESWRDV